MRKPLAGLLVGLASALLVLVSDGLLGRALADRNPFQAIELKTYDWRLSRTAQPATARKDIALVEIDEYSLKNLEPQTGRWPWPRMVHSMLIDFLARGPAKVIVYDVVFAGADERKSFEAGGTTISGTESDEMLAASVTKAGTVILPVDATYESETKEAKTAVADQGFAVDLSGFVERTQVFPPFGKLAGAATLVAHNLAIFDPDGPLRHSVPFVRTGRTAIPSLGVAAAIRAGETPPSAVYIDGDWLRIGDAAMPLQQRRTRNADGATTYQWSLVNFRGPAFLDDLTTRPYASYRAFDLISAENALLNDQKPEIDPAVFRGKIVFVGATATALFDAFETPFAQGKMPGMQVHASVADDILSHRFVGPTGRGARWLTVAAMGLMVGLAATTQPASWATAALLLSVGLLGWGSLALFARGTWINLSQPILASSLALFGGVAYQFFVEGREKRKMQRLFGQYVSKDVFARLVEHPELARLGGERREMTVLFSDIRGFTTVTERGQPEDTVQMLNEYFTRMVEVVFKHKGTLDKFVGDMVMALFNAPLDDADHAEHAVQAALEMIDELQRLNARWKAEGRFAELDIGIGVNTGPMIAGNIGSEAIMSYTVIGDAVNLGSRLESLNKQYGTRIIISDATRKQLSGRYKFKALGDVVVKGKTQPVEIFEVVGRDGGTEPAATTPTA
ncbi:MAG: adenylate/guanylate cyclase domain-containing protein [Vicinamibacterales bacterium]